MSGRTITKKIFDSHYVKPAKGGIWIDVDILLTHDVCGPPAKDIFRDEFGRGARVWDPNKIVIIPDHYIFTKDEKCRRNVDEMREFAKEQGLPFFYDVNSKNYKGVCHVALPYEGHVRPGEVIYGTDSHTCTHGALGAYAEGVGNSEGAFIMGTGKIVVNVPPSILFRIDNVLPDYVMAKDLILRIIGDIGTDGADYMMMEFIGQAISAMSIEERMTFCNMGVEAGGNAIIAPDRKVIDFVLPRSKKPITRSELEQDIEYYQSDPDAEYVAEHPYDASQLEPVVAQPHSPGNVARVRDLKDVKINSGYLGSCTGGKIEDFIAAARILKGREVVVPLYLAPSTTEVAAQIKTEKVDGQTLETIFRESGANMDSIDQPSCAACLGGPVDTYGRINNDRNHVRVSTTNRNFPRRMGDGNIYLGSPLTVAASAITGKLTDPREFMR